MWEVLHVSTTPYGEVKTNMLEHKIASTPDYRPNVTVDQQSEAGVSVLVDLMIKCWDHEPSKRPSFAQVCEILK